MLFLGILCFLYYGIIAWHLKKWNSTFSRFWIVAGIGFLALHTVSDIYPEFRRTIAMGLGIEVFVFAVIGSRILACMKTKADDNLSYIIVLGARLIGTRVSDSLRRRLDAAIEYMKKNPDTIAIVSGGQGPGEAMTEAKAMKEYMVSKGILAERIIEEDQSSTTRENMVFSRKLVGEDVKEVGIVTNNFHLYRSGLYAKKAGYVDVRYLSASCHPILFLNYLVREIIAIIVLKIRK